MYKLAALLILAITAITCFADITLSGTGTVVLVFFLSLLTIVIVTICGTEKLKALGDN